LVVLVVSGILSLSMVISSSLRSWLLVDGSGEGGGRECCFGDGLGLGGRQEQVHKGCRMVFHLGHCMVGGEREH
jgi:hypothetical protein